MQSAYEIRTAPDAVWNQGVGARSQFITRTYAHLLGAIVAFTAIEMVIFATGAAESIARALLSVPGGWLVVLGGLMVVSWIASRTALTASSAAAQYAALGAFVTAEALIFVPLLFIAGQYYPGVITSAAAITLIGFTGLTAIAFITRKDFSFLGGLLRWGMLCALLAIVGAVIFGFTLGPFFCVAMIALAGAAVLHDTSDVLHRYPHDRHVAASLQLFASIALMLWYVISLLMSSRD